MYNHQLRVHGEYLAKGQSLPANSSIEGNEGKLAAGSMLGAAEVVAIATDKVTIAANKTFSLSLKASDDDSSFSDVPVRFSQTAGSVPLNVAAGEVLARLPIASDMKRFVKVVLTTDDAAVTGAVDVFFEYLPR